MKQIPRYTSSNRIQNYFAMRQDPIAFLEKVNQRNASITRFTMLSFSYLLINDPNLIGDALVKHSETMIIKGGASSALARLIGHGILTNHGSDWRTSRSLLKPLFKQATLEKAIVIIKNCTENMIKRWKSSFLNQEFAVSKELLMLSLDIKCRTLFDYQASELELLKCADAIGTLQSDGADRYMSGLDYLSALPISINNRVHRAKKQLFQTAQTINKSFPSVPVDELISILFAGSESPSTSLVWAMSLLEKHLDWYQSIQALDSTEMSLAKIESFDVTSQVLSETMRLYPAGWAFERYANKTTNLLEYEIPQGSRLLISPYLLHRKAEYWQDPTVFNPLRFNKNPLSAKDVPKFAYLPFGAGPRSCIGYRLAMLEMKIILKMLVKNCNWQLNQAGSKAIKPWGSFKLRLAEPVSARVHFLS